MMKKEWLRGLMGIALILVLFFGFFIFCENLDRQKSKTKQMDQEEEYEETENGKTWAERGYILRGNVQENVKLLLESEEPLFMPEDYVYEQIDGEKLNMQKVNKEYNILKETLFESEDPTTMESYGEMVVGPTYAGVSTILSFDAKQCKFTDDKIPKIEACGFPGFAERIKEVENKIQKRKEHEHFEDDIETYGVEYKICCQGVEFILSAETNDTFVLTLIWNDSSRFIPGKYQSMIEEIEADGKYYLYSSCVGVESDVLVFNRDNTVATYDREEYQEGDNKRIAFIFKDGVMADYYFASSANTLVLDEADEQMLDTYAKGFGKELSRTGESSYYSSYSIFSAE